MTGLDCVREQEVLSAILAGRWPQACEDELRTHAAGCATCGEVAEVASLMRDDYNAARDVRLPGAGQVWWRAAVRARLEAGQAAARPITWIYGLTGASAAGLAVVVMSLAWPSLRDVVGWALAQVAALDAETAAIAALAGNTILRALPFAIAIAAVLVLAPVALYFALSDD